MICKLDRGNTTEFELEQLITNNVEGIENTIKRQTKIIANLLECLYKKSALNNDNLNEVLEIGGVYRAGIIETKDSWCDDWKNNDS